MKRTTLFVAHDLRQLVMGSCFQDSGDGFRGNNDLVSSNAFRAFRPGVVEAYPESGELWDPAYHPTAAQSRQKDFFQNYFPITHTDPGSRHIVSFLITDQP